MASLILQILHPLSNIPTTNVFCLPVTQQPSSQFLGCAQAMRLFLVWDSEGISETKDTVIEDLFSAVDADSDCEDAKPKRKSTKLTKLKKESSEEESVEESNEQSGSDDDSEQDCHHMKKIYVYVHHTESKHVHDKYVHVKYSRFCFTVLGSQNLCISCLGEFTIHIFPGNNMSQHSGSGANTH